MPAIQPAGNMIERNILTELGLDRLSPEKQEETLLQIGRLIYQAVLIRALDRLSEEEQKDFERILNEHPDDESMLVNFLEAKVPDLDRIIQEEVQKFKDETSALLKENEEKSGN
jgi:hypothetical protein